MDSIYTSRQDTQESLTRENEHPGYMTRELIAYTAGQWERLEVDVIVETPVSLTVNGDTWLTLMCTPIDLEALAIGFVFNEGLIQSMDEVASVRVCPGLENIDLWLHHKIEKPARWRRTSGCTGGMTAVNGESSAPHIYNGITLNPDQIQHLVRQLLEYQELYRKSGGVHTSALSDGKTIHLIAEDIGRHNTLDKISGRCLMQSIELPIRILLTTGRLSSEMLQKAARIGTSVVISRTAPSSLAIHLAEKWGITLVGYARRDRFKIYAHPERMCESQYDQ